MIIHQTALQKEVIKRLTELDFYLAADKHHLLKSEKEIYKLNRLLAGAEGERIALEYLKKFGKSHWVILPNFWMNYFGPFECDFILLTNYKCYLFEIKNYRSEFVYKDGIVKIDGIQRNFNPIHQTRRNYQNLQEIINKIFPHITVEGATIFTGINNAVFIKSEVSDIKIIPRSYLKWYIDQIIKEEQNSRGQPIDIKGLISQLLKFEIQQSYLPDAISQDRMSTAKKGIYCAKCHSYHVKVNRFSIECRCGYQEDRENAILRAIYDYAVLNYDKKLTTNNLLDFLNRQVSKTYLLKILNQHFTTVKKSSESHYIINDFSEFKSKLNL